MQAIEDKFFDLAIVDPPYGIATDNLRMGGSRKRGQPTTVKAKNRLNSGGGKLKNSLLTNSDTSWDVAPDKAYFDELFRVSKNQIIRGGNYFDLPPTRCIVCWDKMQAFENFSQVEIAWTSFDHPAKLFRYPNSGTCPDKSKRIHATQKPIALYHFLLKRFAKPGDRIFDSHLGSGSSRIAAYKMGFDFYATEINEMFFVDQEKRFNEVCKNTIQFPNGTTITHKDLFDEN